MIKQATHLRRSQATKRIVISSSSQAMPKPSDWQDFLASSENKTELITFLVNYYRSNNNSIPLNCPLIINNGEATWIISPNLCERLPDSNHHEADTRVAYLASISKNNVIACATDTDILLLLVFAFALVKPRITWRMRISTDRYICIRSISIHYGDKVCAILPAFHSLTGCDTTSCPFGVRKKEPFKKILKAKKGDILQELGTSIVFTNELGGAMKFLQTVVYPGKDNEDMVQNSVRMYERLKEKCSSKLIPDPSNSLEHLKRANV